MNSYQPINGVFPTVHSSAFVADSAVLIGDVQVAADASIWYGAVLRGDVGAIRIGARSNIQDLSVVHCTFQYSDTIVGKDVTVGHRAILHGCTIEDCCLIGMGAIVMDRAIVGRHSIVAAGAVVLENAVLESGYLYAGTPARKIKALSPDQIAGLQQSADHYLKYKQWYENG